MTTAPPREEDPPQDGPIKAGAEKWKARGLASPRATAEKRHRPVSLARVWSRSQMLCHCAAGTGGCHHTHIPREAPGSHLSRRHPSLGTQIKARRVETTAKHRAEAKPLLRPAPPSPQEVTRCPAASSIQQRLLLQTADPDSRLELGCFPGRPGRTGMNLNVS